MNRAAWIRSIALVTALATLLLMTVPAGAVAPTDPFVPGQVVIRLLQPAQQSAIAQQYGLVSVPVDQLPVHGLYLMAIADGTAADVKAAQIASDPRVLYAEADFVGIIPEEQGMSSWESGMSSWESGNPTAYVSQWAPNAMRLSEAQRVTRGRGVKVAVLDSGVDLAHPALAGKLVAGYDFVDNDADPSEAPSGPGVGHGTHVAGLVALAAPEVSIMPVRVLDRTGAGDMWRIAKGLVWASDPDGDPTTADGADVINLSLSTFSRSHVMTDLVSEMANGGHGVVLVAAAGNSGSTRPEYPAGEGGSRLLSVGATTSPGFALAPFSNRGSWVDVAAPGDRITSSVPGARYATYSGTSMAAALASGEAALVRAAFPTFDARQVIARIEKAAHTDASDTPPRLDAAAAVGG